MAQAGRILLLLLLVPGLALAAGCSDDGVAPPDDGDPGEEPEPQPVTEEEAEEAVLDFLVDRGLLGSVGAQELWAAEADDIPNSAYTTRDETDTGNPRIHIWLDGDGALFPSGEWFEENPDYCADQNRSKRGAQSRVTITIYNDAFEVSVQEINIETGQVEQAGQARGSGEDWLPEAMKAAWDELDDDTVKPAEDPCGAEFGARLLMDSRIEIYYDGEFVQASHVETEIGLAPSDEGDDLYEGTGVVEHVEYWDIIHSGACEIEEIPGHFAAEAVFPAGPLQHHSDIEVTLSPAESESFPYVVIQCPDADPDEEWVWAPHFLIHHNDDRQSTAVDLTGWQPSDDDQVVAWLDFDRERLVYPDDGGEPVLSVEATDLEILRLEED